MTSSATSKQLEIRVGPAADALDRFEAAWNRAAEGRPARPLEILSFADLPLLLKNLSPARWELLARLRKEGPLSIYQLAKRLGRDYKNVHTDVTRLLQLGLVSRGKEGEMRAKIRVSWDVVRGQF